MYGIELVNMERSRLAKCLYDMLATNIHANSIMHQQTHCRVHTHTQLSLVCVASLHDYMCYYNETLMHLESEAKETKDAKLILSANTNL